MQRVFLDVDACIEETEMIWSHFDLISTAKQEYGSSQGAGSETTFRQRAILNFENINLPIVPDLAI